MVSLLESGAQALASRAEAECGTRPTSSVAELRGENGMETPRACGSFLFIPHCEWGEFGTSPDVCDKSCLSGFASRLMRLSFTENMFQTH